MTVDRNLLFTNFAKAIISKDKEKDTVDSVNATVHMVGEDIFVEIDGAEGTRTPANTLIEVTDEQRVQAEIKNHVVTIVGSSENVAVGNSSYQRLKSVVADEAYIDELIANNLTIGGVVKASNATVEELDADYAKFKNVVIDQGQFDELVGTDLTLTGMLFGKDADFKKIVTNNAFVKGTLSASGLVAADGTIINLKNTYADIKFAHIGEEAVNNLYAKKGTIGAASIDSDGIHIAGDVVGINIHGDVIEGNTVKAESLIIKGSDGLYHQLNVDGGIKIEELTEEQQDEYNSKLHGSNIIANTITADQIYVDDLSALDATIGGFHISQGSVEENKPGAIYSGVKESIANTTNGVYMDDEGQFYLGNNSSYLKFYKYTKEDGTEDYKLDISASSLKMSTGTLDLGQIEQAIDDASKVATNYLQFDSDGLVIGDLTDPDNPSNVLIDSYGINIRNGEDTLSSFNNNSIVLGNETNAHIRIHQSEILFIPENYNDNVEEKDWKVLQIKNDGIIYRQDGLSLRGFNTLVAIDGALRNKITSEINIGIDSQKIKLYGTKGIDIKTHYEINSPSATLTTDSDGNLFVNDQLNAQLANENGYWGIKLQSNNTFLRTPPEGIIPSQSGGKGTVGTSGWPFYNGFFNNLYVNGQKYQIQAGIIYPGTMSGSSSKDVTITFTKAFSQTPSVTARMAGNTGQLDKYPISINWVGATGVTFRIYNNSSGNANMSVPWIAINPTQ